MKQVFANRRDWRDFLKGIDFGPALPYAPRLPARPPAERQPAGPGRLGASGIEAFLPVFAENQRQ
jgi:hypothetical protein